MRRGIDMSLAFDAIHQLRDFAEGENLRDADATEAQIVASIRGEDEAPDFTASLVEDAQAAAAYALRCAVGGDVMNAVWAARRAYEAADRYAGLRQNVTAFTDAAEEAILGHPTVQSELRRQRRDVQELEHMRDDPKGFAMLIDRAGREPLLG
jgi:hypothetical protein